MVVKNIQIHVENGFASQKIRHFYYLQAKLSSLSLSPPQGRVKLLIPKFFKPISKCTALSQLF